MPLYAKSCAFRLPPSCVACLAPTVEFMSTDHHSSGGVAVVEHRALAYLWSKSVAALSVFLQRDSYSAVHVHHLREVLRAKRLGALRVLDTHGEGRQTNLFNLINL